MLLLLVVAALIHTRTAWWDVAYAERRRRITPFEQVVHGFLIVIPVIGTALIFAQQWDRFRAIWSAVPSDWSLRWKRNSIPSLYLAAVLLPAGAFAAIPAAGRIRAVLARATARNVKRPT